ncbi:MAG TPA: hypothetical protein VFQ39_16165, partial [Longimicrobium sp.]|nr:hypothetical protein [Longimicrobium sp.]
RADRKRPPGRYRMPGEPPPVEAPPANAFVPPPPPPALRLLGTVVLADGSGLAALAGQNGQSRVVRIGQSMDGFRLVRVTRGTATLRGNDTTLVLKNGGTQ